MTPFTVLLKAHVHTSDNSEMLLGELDKCATKDEAEGKPPTSRAGIARPFENKLKILWFRSRLPACLPGCAFFFFFLIFNNLKI